MQERLPESGVVFLAVGKKGSRPTVKIIRAMVTSIMSYSIPQMAANAIENAIEQLKRALAGRPFASEFRNTPSDWFQNMRQLEAIFVRTFDDEDEGVARREAMLKVATAIAGKMYLGVRVLVDPTPNDITKADKGHLLVILFKADGLPDVAQFESSILPKREPNPRAFESDLTPSQRRRAA
jgi:hypothetical protein